MNNYLPKTPAIFNDKNRITVSADPNNDIITTLFIKKADSISKIDEDPSITVVLPEPSEGIDILNITSPVPINRTDKTNK